ncbi:MAG: hypothetical protein ACKO23_01995 [Gemmataceae bacterium]
MKRNWILWLVTLAGSVSGCHYTGSVYGPWDTYSLTFKNLHQGSSYYHDSVGATSKFKQEALRAWKAIRKSDPSKQYSIDYADGFKEGFIDYLDAGGTGEPPLYPPFRYRKSSKASPEMIQGIQDWYAGFRHGSRVAKESGIRSLLVLPMPGPPNSVNQLIGGVSPPESAITDGYNSGQKTSAPSNAASNVSPPPANPKP